MNRGHPFEDDIPIYDPATDRKRLYGGPCLSHLSIKVHDGKVRFNATYRSHIIATIRRRRFLEKSGRPSVD